MLWAVYPFGHFSRRWGKVSRIEYGNESTYVKFLLKGESTQFLRNFVTRYLQPLNILETTEELEILELSSEPKNQTDYHTDSWRDNYR